MMIVIYVVAAALVFWLGMITAFLGGLVFVVLAAVGAGLKLADVTALSWWWALLFKEKSRQWTS